MLRRRLAVLPTALSDALPALVALTVAALLLATLALTLASLALAGGPLELAPTRWEIRLG